MSCYWTPARDEKLRALWPNRALSLSKIAIELATVSEIDQRIMSGGYISAHAKELKLMPRVLCNRVRSERPFAERGGYMMKEASKRGLTLTELVRRIMKTVEHDKMVDAILDDQDNTVVPAQPARVA